MIAVVVAGFSVTLASQWAADDEDGRLDLILATPHPRHRVMLARFAALSVALVAVAAAIAVSGSLTASAAGYAMDSRRLAQAAFGTVPIASPRRARLSSPAG